MTADLRAGQISHAFAHHVDGHDMRHMSPLMSRARPCRAVPRRGPQARARALTAHQRGSRRAPTWRLTLRAGLAALLPVLALLCGVLPGWAASESTTPAARAAAEEATKLQRQRLTFGVLNHDRDKCLERSEVASFVRERLSIEEFDDACEVESAVQSIFRNHNSTKDQCISGAEFDAYVKHNCQTRFPTYREVAEWMEWAAQLPKVAHKLRDSNVNCNYLRLLIGATDEDLAQFGMTNSIEREATKSKIMVALLGVGALPATPVVRTSAAASSAAKDGGEAAALGCFGDASTGTITVRFNKAPRLAPPPPSRALRAVARAGGAACAERSPLPVHTYTVEVVPPGESEGRVLHRVYDDSEPFEFVDNVRLSPGHSLNTDAAQYSSLSCCTPPRRAVCRTCQLERRSTRDVVALVTLVAALCRLWDHR